MSRYSVGIVKYGIDPNARCFEDFARAVKDALIVLGHDVVPVTDRKPGRIIMFGAGQTTDPGSVYPDGILFNTEQVAAISEPFKFISREWRDKTVWDYSQANIARLRANEFQKVVYCPVGYIESMTHIEPVEEDIDVLFYGSMCGARREVLDALEEAGLRVARPDTSRDGVPKMYNIYGPERDAVIARSKVVLNMHYYPNGVYEIFRVSHLLANRKCVVSVAGGCDAGLEAFAARATCYVAKKDVVEACRELVVDVNKRRVQAEQGFNEFVKISLVESVRHALEQS